MRANACIRLILVGFAILALATSAQAGKVILGGDDLTDHGFRSGSTNMLGWLYIEKAIGAINPSVTRPGPFTVTIAAIGSADVAGCPPTCPGGNAGAAIKSVADVLGLTVAFFDGPAAITSFFTGLGNGSINPKILWIAGTGAVNDIDSTEGPVITANAAAINAFVSSGGGLMAHGSGTDAYGWLSALLPGLIETFGCTADPGATLTAAGVALFPGLSNTDINAGPCHSHFEGNFGGLSVLALDGANPSRAFILGGDLTGGGFTGGGCGLHTVHGHISTVPPDHFAASHVHHGQHGHTVTMCSPPHHGPFHMTGETEEQGVLSASGPADSLDFVVAVNQDGAIGAARRGTVLQLFGSARGLFIGGQHDQPAEGFTPAASGSPLFQTTTLPQVRISGTVAKVLFSGLAPGLTGVWQINVLVPEEVPAGTLPIAIDYEGDTLTSREVNVE